MKPDGPLAYRYLEPHELDAARALFEDHGYPFPDPRLAQYVGAFAPDGSLAGVMPLQLVPHAEPVVVREQWRAAVDWDHVVALGDGLCRALGLPGWLVVAQDRHVELLARRCGMREMEGRLYERELP